jgi:hypothetical protein
MNAPIHREIPASALLDTHRALAGISARWNDDIVPRLTRYITIPAKSPAFDPDWAAHGHIETVVREAADWVLAQKVPGLRLEIVRLQKARRLARARRCCSSRLPGQNRPANRPS